MPMSHRRSAVPVRRSSRAPRRRSLWSTTNSGNLTVATGLSITPQNLLTDISLAGVGMIGGTITRVHFRLSCTCANTDTNPGLLFGLQVWDKTTTTPSVPDINGDFNLPWMYINQLSPGDAPGGAVNLASSFAWGESIDVRAQRRLLNVNDNLFFYLHNLGSTTLNFGFFSRVLIKLP